MGLRWVRGRAEDSIRSGGARLGAAARLAAHPQSEDPAIDLGALVASAGGAIVIGLLVALVVVAAALVAVVRRVSRLEARLRTLTGGTPGGGLDDVLDAHIATVHGVARDLDDVRRRTGALEAAGRKAFQRVGLVRYNPFEETGGNQSFALALLDADGDGWVLSSLHARNGTRVYAKAIARGRSDAALSDEEAAAIRQATVLPA